MSNVGKKRETWFEFVIALKLNWRRKKRLIGNVISTAIYHQHVALEEPFFDV